MRMLLSVFCIFPFVYVPARVSVWVSVSFSSTYSQRTDCYTHWMWCTMCSLCISYYYYCCFGTSRLFYYLFVACTWTIRTAHSSPHTLYYYSINEMIMIEPKHLDYGFFKLFTIICTMWVSLCGIYWSV